MSHEESELPDSEYPLHPGGIKVSSIDWNDPLQVEACAYALKQLFANLNAQGKALSQLGYPGGIFSLGRYYKRQWLQGRGAVVEARRRLRAAAIAHGTKIPYHTAFPAAFLRRLVALPSWETATFVEIFCLENNLTTTVDYTYLAGIVTDALRSQYPQHLGLGNALERLMLRHKQEEARTHPTPTLKWTGSKTELAELAYALLETGLIETRNREKAILSLAAFFGVADMDPIRQLQSLQRRTAAKATPLLDRLKKTLVNYLTKSK